ncbi:hypothetical protein, partial [Escherichia coli]|uniref:hypothetical protein n=1 Tax=Escherichia coli TaxID=562 RepID=UPI001C38740D
LALCRCNATGRRQSESRVRENRTHGLTRGRWGDYFKPEAYSTSGSKAAQCLAGESPAAVIG